MKKIQIVGIIAGALILIASCFSGGDKETSANRNNSSPTSNSGDVKTAISLPTASNSILAPQTQDLSEKETTERLENSKKAIETLFSLSAYNNTEEDLVKSLRELNLNPELGSDKNEDTGEMLMIRSKTEIPGVRYFHAQYFSNDDGGFIPQHMSFEMQPGPNNFQNAIELVKKQFEISEKPKYQKKDYIHWEIDGGRTVHITILDKLLMEDNPWNAYDLEKDKGTVKITVELDPHHGMAEDDGHFGHSDQDNG